jgi:hypothetical protein
VGSSVILSRDRLKINYLDDSSVIKTWDQKIYFLYGFRFESCDYLYDGH